MTTEPTDPIASEPAAPARRWPRLTPLRVILGVLVASWMTMALVFWLWILPAGVITVRVQGDEIPGGKLQFSMPGVLSLALLPFVPDEVWEEAAAGAREWLPASRAALRELRQSPDFVLVQVHTCKEQVRVVKEGRHLQVHVADPKVEVRARVPIAVLDLVLTKIRRCDGRRTWSAPPTSASGPGTALRSAKLGVLAASATLLVPLHHVAPSRSALTSPRRSASLPPARRWVLSPILALLLLGIVGALVPDPPAPARPGAAPASDAGWWRSVRTGLERAEYAVTPAGNGLQAPNRAQNLRTRFAASGIEVAPRTWSGSWRVQWRTQAAGRPGAMRSLSPVEPQANGARVSYVHPGLVEWYENRPAGLEQGFTIGERPAGSGPLRITGVFTGDAQPSAVEHQGDVTIELRTADVHVLDYAGLRAWDARGRELPARFELSGCELALEVDDRAAEYPLLVDPLVTSPSWTAESNQAAAQFGGAVATAGDVNADGFSDVLVGASFWDGGEANEGRVFLFLGSPTGLATNPAWSAESNQANSGFGAALGSAGDVNGDGFGDVIIGAFAYDNGQDNEGSAFVYLGSASGLGPSAAWSAESNQAQAFMGLSVATAGDVNGDGFGDVIVGISEFDNGESNEGRALVFHGSASGLATTAAWSAESNQAGSNFGIAVATAGDVNGDGFGDVLAGAHLYDDGSVNEGGAFLYLGSASGLSPTAAWQKGADQDGALFGHGLAGAGDVNGDGYADCVIGAELFDNGETNEGRAFLFLGHPTGLGAVAAWTFESNQGGATSGRFVATAGDVNGDGFADVVIGAPSFDNGESNEGRAFAFLGGASGLPASPIWTAESDQADATFGTVATAGDVNGDGFSDLLVGASAFDGGESDEGRAYVYHGGAYGLSATPAWTNAGDQAGAELGFAVAGAGDVNGDGYSDLLIGAPGFDSGVPDGGRAALYLGAPLGPDSVAAWFAEGSTDSARFGHAVAGALDLNGDGYSDVVIGAPGFTAGAPGEGGAFAYLGSATGLAAAPVFQTVGGQADAACGAAVAGAGDLNGDGRSELAIGIPGYDSLAVDGGRARIYFGGMNGPGPNPGWTVDGAQAGAQLGAAIASAGDANRDGFSDLLVGAPGYANGELAEGQAALYLGSSFGPAVTADWTWESDQAGAELGAALASAGDVNGDGYSDLLLGAPGLDAPLPAAGRVFVFHGAAGGPAAVPDWTQSGAHEQARFGQAVASAGDVNGDGASDVVVGAPGDGPGGEPRSRVELFLGSAAGLSGSPTFSAVAAAAGDALGRAVASGGDVNADGFADLLIGAPGDDSAALDAGRVALHPGNAAGMNGRFGLDRRAQQARADDLAPIDLLGQGDSPISYRLRILGRSAAGRTRVRLEWQVVPLGTPFGSALAQGPRFDTGAPLAGVGSASPTSQFITGLAPQTALHWRARLLSDSPYFPRTPWLSPPGNGAAEADFRTPEVLAVVTTPAPALPGLRLEPAFPNPFRARTEIAYELVAPGAIRLRVFDVTGREVARLADERQPAGRHRHAWDGRDARGQELASGVYFLRLEQNGLVQSRKLVLAR